MFGIQNIVDASILKIFQLDNLGASVIEKYLSKRGINLNDGEIQHISDKLKCISEAGSFSFHIDDERISKETGLTKNEIELIASDCMANFVKSCEDAIASVTDGIPEMLDSIIDSTSHEMYSRLIQQFEAIDGEHSLLHEVLNNEIQDFWGRPLKLLRSFIALAEESGECHDENAYDDLSEFESTATLLPILHAKVVQIAKEILCLLCNGYSEGAFARWRSLHELSIICHFITETGNETAARFMDHEIIEMHKHVLSNNEHERYSGILRYTSVNLEYLQSEYDRCLLQYGDSFMNDFGWASKVLNKKRPTFADIEEFTENKHQRPFCITANSKIHANALGIFYNLGTLASNNEVISGPSSLGLDEPGILTAQSLCYGITFLLTINPKVDNLIASKILINYMNEVIAAFQSASEMVESSDELNARPEKSS